MIFDKIKKPFALNNSYFKNRSVSMPKDPLECLRYKSQHGERPFKGDYDIYDIIIEYQKRYKAGINLFDQYYTPPKVACRLAELARFDYENENIQYPTILDACCGFGQITRYLTNNIIYCFDTDIDNINIANILLKSQENNNIHIDHCKFEDGFYSDKIFDCIVANPPYGKSSSEIDKFMKFIDDTLSSDGQAILLLPNGYFESQRPKSRVDLLKNWRVLYKELSKEEFVHTKINTTIYIIKRA